MQGCSIICLLLVAVGFLSNTTKLLELNFKNRFCKNNIIVLSNIFIRNILIQRYRKKTCKERENYFIRKSFQDLSIYSPTA